VVVRATEPADEDQPDLTVPDAALVALAERLQGLCLERRYTVGAAESCTGGRIAAAITAVPGASGYFLGSLVTYADAAKRDLLGVLDTTLADHGAVSPETATAMATGALERLGCTHAVSVTGVAGPDGGSDAKPVGLVYLGLASFGSAATRRFTFAGDREAVQNAATAAALAWLMEAVAG
jgi:PncC family amidohydrolase